MFDFSLIGVKKNIPEVNFTSYSGLFIAPPKFGKTTTASKFPNAVIAPFEDGVKGQVANVIEDLSSWKDFINFIDKLEQNREAIGDNVETIVFDTVNKAYDMCEPYTLKLLSRLDGKRYLKPSDVPHGGFYPARDKEFSKQIDRILSLGFSILFVSHSKVKTIKPKNGEPYDVYSSTMPDRLDAIITPLVDFLLYGERRVIDGEPKRVLVTKASDMANGGNRVYLDEDIAFDTEDEAMEKYQEEFKKTVIKRLEEEGISEDYETLSKKQKEDKMKEVKKYLEETQEKKTSEQLVKEIDDAVKNMSSEQTTKFKEQLKSANKTVNYKKYTEISQLETAVEIAKDILG